MNIKIEWLVALVVETQGSKLLNEKKIPSSLQ